MAIGAATIAQLYGVQTGSDREFEFAVVQAMGFAMVLAINV